MNRRSMPYLVRLIRVQRDPGQLDQALGSVSYRQPAQDTGLDWGHLDPPSVQINAHQPMTNDCPAGNRYKILSSTLSGQPVDIVQIFPHARHNFPLSVFTSMGAASTSEVNKLTRASLPYEWSDSQLPMFGVSNRAELIACRQPLSILSLWSVECGGHA